jgi:gliding motility-associated-like protein
MTVSPDVHNASCNESKNGAVHLTINGGTPPYNYIWNNGNHARDLQSVGPGAYEVTVTDDQNCTAESTVNIVADYNMQAQLAPVASVKAGEPIQLIVTTNTDHGNTYSWSPANNVACPTCATTEAWPQQNTTYIVTVIDANGCKAFDTVSVEVTPITGLFVPNAFTPNGDGTNDEFQVFGDMGTVHYFALSIFNRWGEKVFESNNYNTHWDGTFGGAPSPQGTYVYILEVAFSDGSHKDYKGSITLLR